jgi:hypothetical protein
MQSQSKSQQEILWLSTYDSEVFMELKKKKKKKAGQHNVEEQSWRTGTI